MESRGGHVPDSIVREVIHRLYTSTDSVATTFAGHGFRFVVGSSEGAIVATVLVSKEPDVVLGYCSTSPIGRAVKGQHPLGLHSIFNLAVAPAWRRRGIARALLDDVELHFRSYFTGVGWWVRSEPPDHDIYLRLGFVHEPSYDGFLMSGVSPSAVFDSVGEYNARYWCNCLENRGRRSCSPVAKVKHWAFTRMFCSRSL
ncbi:MAG TPA: GNAT family N-acetyltransferase [Thermoanaerobaculia bacterium]|nr:GNAT family N-acetyltransferase [Thermoanaerobaculia bacterium]